jgi:hypothetical protein
MYDQNVGDRFSGVLPTAGVADRLTGGNGVPPHECRVEWIERARGKWTTPTLTN